MEGCWQHTDFRPSTCSRCGGIVFGFDGEHMCFTCVAKDATLLEYSAGQAISPQPGARVAGDGCTREEPTCDPPAEKLRNVYVGVERKGRVESRRPRKKKPATPPASPAAEACPRHARPSMRYSLDDSVDEAAAAAVAECTCTRRHRRQRARRPSPEGHDRYDEVLYASEPLYSDYGSDSDAVPETDDRLCEERQARLRARLLRRQRQQQRLQQQQHQQQQQQQQQHGRHTPEALFSEAMQRVCTTGTSLKFSIIGVELKDVSTALRKLREACAALLSVRRLPEPPTWHRGAWLDAVAAEAADAAAASGVGYNIDDFDDFDEILLLDEVRSLLADM